MPRLSRQRAFLFGVGAMTVLAGVAHYANTADLLAFALATLALAGLAWVVSHATEQVGERFGPAVTGVLQSTLGNLPEFFIVIFALSDGQVVVAQTSIIGSIFANALLVLGLVIVAGAWRSEDKCMSFRQRLPQDTATLLLVAVFLIVIVGLAVGQHDRASHHVQAISTIGSVCLLAVYVAWVIPYLRGQGEEREPDRPAPGTPLALAIGLLAAAGAASAFVSDWFVSALQPTIHQLHLSQEFAGLVIVAIAGNAVENATGVILAWKGQSDLAISVVKNSVAQVAAFLFPVLVLVSLLFATPLTFALAPVFIGALALTAITVWQITGDGQAAMFEGWALIALFVILAVFTLYD
jgi:Ca2+:H+ antiporter